MPHELLDVVVGLQLCGVLTPLSHISLVKLYKYYNYHSHYYKKIGKIFITKPQLRSYLQSTCCYKKSNQFIKTLSTIPSLENKNNPIYNK